MCFVRITGAKAKIFGFTCMIPSAGSTQMSFLSRAKNLVGSVSQAISDISQIKHTASELLKNSQQNKELEHKMDTLASEFEKISRVVTELQEKSNASKIKHDRKKSLIRNLIVTCAMLDLGVSVLTQRESLGSVSHDFMDWLTSLKKHNNKLIMEWLTSLKKDNKKDGNNETWTPQEKHLL